ncbi:MAG: transporter substrate-binding domain-containing protein [Chitinophagales bacterium]
MKNKLAIFLILIMSMIIIAGCGSNKTDKTSETTAKIQNTADLKGKTVAMVDLGAEFDKKAMILQRTGVEPQKIENFDRCSDCITAVVTGKVDAVFVPKFVGHYYVGRNNKLKLIECRSNADAAILMAVRGDDRKLKQDLDKAITTLKENGTLKRLEDEWIIKLPVNKEPSYKEPTKIEGAKTIYVGISGDYTPLDYIAADGKPAGYNVVLLGEIGKLMGVNFEFVPVENKARLAALASKKIDVVFIHWYYGTGKSKDGSWLGTTPYYTFKDSCFIVKK